MKIEERIASLPIKKEAIEAYKNGKTPKEIAEQYGVPLPTVYTWVRSIGNSNNLESSDLEYRRLKRKAPNEVDAIRSKVLSEYDRGARATDLARKYNISRGVIYLWLKNREDGKLSSEPITDDELNSITQNDSLKKENEELKQKISELEETLSFYKNHIKKLDNYIDRLEKELENVQSKLPENLENREKHRRIH